MNNILEQMANHLEFLGYSVEIVNHTEPTNSSLIARHSEEPTVYLVELEPGMVFARSSFNTSTSCTPEEMNAAINEMSAAVDLVNPFYEIKEDKVVLRFDANYTGEYSKQVFAKFITRMRKDIRRMYDIPIAVKAFVGD